MSDSSLEDLIKRALTFGILDMDQVHAIWKKAGTQNLSVDEFLQETLRQGIFTKYQMERLKFGETTGFFYGDYKVLYLVGAGSFARVYRCVHRTTGEYVALKVLRSRFLSNQAVVDQFLKEAELGMDLHHPNIVAIHSVVNDRNDKYMIMDFVEGQTLRDVLKVQKIMPPKLATKVITDICQALDYAFNKGQSHRDMKLSNVILSSTGKAVLIDFGLAAPEQDPNDKDKEKNQRVVDYAALEKITCVPRNDRRSDIYFLGTMYYHLLAGTPPLFETTDRAKRMDRMRFINVHPLREKNPSVPPVLSYIVEKAMSLDPSKRYQTPGEMLAELELARGRLETGKTAEFLSAQEQGSRTEAAEDIPSILVVEANPDLQGIFRESFRKAGFKVLVLSDTERAVEQFDYTNRKIDCILINAQNIGAKAVLAFNQLGENPITFTIPAILLLEENQIKWAAKAARGRNRVAVVMPIAMKRLLGIMNKLINEAKTKAESGTPAQKPQIKPKTPAQHEQSNAAMRAAAAMNQAENPQMKTPAAPKKSMSDTGIFTKSDSAISSVMAKNGSDSAIFNAAFDAALDDVLNSLADPEKPK
ncbi:MAG: serine/threonine-protein kinase [Planctomycetia bacterium]|nr:serine/threonine-protein kinase [Planctomycetia bacterium]